MTDSTWNVSGTGDYNTAGNWSFNVPVIGDTGFFGTSTHTNISILTLNNVGEWFFAPGASQYNFAIAGSASIRFFGAGIVVNGGGANIDNANDLQFLNHSTAGAATITNESLSGISFKDVSTAGSASINNNAVLYFLHSSSAEHATITNNSLTDFFDFSSAGSANIINNGVLLFNANTSAASATIDTLGGALTEFADFSNPGNAQLITDAGGRVDFSGSAGPANNHQLTVGSIAGAGSYLLGADQLTVGSNGLSTIVSGPITNSGGGGGSGASLVKVGPGTLTLSHAGNTYSGGTTLEAGMLDLAAVGAAGTGAITFTAGPQKLKIENGALSPLSHHVYANPIDFFGKGDVLDLSGLHFHPGAKATYHAASHHLIVNSGGVTDTLTLLEPLRTHFIVASDHHGGTDVLLFHA